MGQANDNAILVGGYNDPAGTYLANTELWNGSSWTEIADLATARGTGAGFGGVTSGLYAAGNTGSASALTEEWTVPEALKTLASTNA